MPQGIGSSAEFIARLVPLLAATLQKFGTIPPITVLVDGAGRIRLEPGDLSGDPNAVMQAMLADAVNAVLAGQCSRAGVIVEAEPEGEPAVFAVLVEPDCLAVQWVVPIHRRRFRKPTLGVPVPASG